MISVRDLTKTCGEIRVKVQGGLGNQLFQIANGLNLALIYDLPISFHYNKTKNRNFVAGFSKISPGNLYRFDGKQCLEIENKPHTYCNFNKYIEKSFRFEEIKLKGRHVELQGYFQSFRYFSHIEEYMRTSIMEQFNIIDSNKNLVDIALHIRLGDYYRNRHNRKIYLLPSYSYLSDSIKKMEELISNTTGSIRVFTDDSKLLNKLYGEYFRKKPHYIFRGNSTESFTEFANHNNKIISNSTFSWWAAWTTNGNIISPTNWFKKKSGLDLVTSDLIPPEWNLIQNE